MEINKSNGVIRRPSKMAGASTCSFVCYAWQRRRSRFACLRKWRAQAHLPLYVMLGKEEEKADWPLFENAGRKHILLS